MTEATVLTKQVDEVRIRCGNKSWGYTRHMQKLTPDFELDFRNLDVIIRDGIPVELQISVNRVWRESMFKGKQDSARLYIRTAEEEKRQGKEDVQIWKHQFDPMGSSTVGPNGKHHPVIVDSIELPDQEVM